MRRERTIKSIAIFYLFSVIILNFLFLNVYLNTPESNTNKNQNLNDLIRNPQTSVIPTNFQLTNQEINISLHQSLNLNPAQISVLNTSDPSNNSIFLECPVDSSFSSTFINISLNQIQAINRTLDVESGIVNSNEDLDNSAPEATNFTVPFDVRLSNVSLNIDMIGKSSNGTVEVYLYNSTWNASNSVSKPLDSSGLGVLLGTINALNDTADWMTLTGLDYFLNTSETDNNTFFIGARRQGATPVPTWRFTDDSTNGDQCASYYYDAFEFTYDKWKLWEVFFETRDYQLKVGYAPVNITPEVLGLKINGTDVTGYPTINGSGYWSNTSQYSSSTGNLEFVLTSTWNNVRCDIEKAQINYTKTNLNGTPTIESSQGGQIIHWNVTREGGLNFYNNRFSSYSINFSIPKSWNNYTIFNGTTNKTDDITGDYVSGNFRTLQVSNAGNGTYWFINATTMNLLQSINIYKIGSLTPITEALNTDNIRVNGSFSQLISQNDGEINLSIYSPDSTNNYLAHSIITSTYPASSIITIDDWDLSSVTSDFGLYRVQTIWYNTSAAGFRDTTFNINQYTSGTDNFPLVFLLIIAVPIIGLVIVIIIQKKSRN